MNKPCECEHAKHFADDEAHDPNAHPFWAECEGVEPVRTIIYGTFNVCQECKNTCLKGYIDEGQHV